MAPQTALTPWYRNHWPWLLMAAPAASVIGGIAMLIVALASDDGLVADDYYKRGLAVNQTLARDRAAAQSGIRARVLFAERFDRVRISLSDAPVAPGALTLRLVHRTRAGLDRTVTLGPTGVPGTYEGALQPPDAGRWRVLLEDGAAQWRLSGEWETPAQSLVLLPH
jgi:hypothetical protein